MSDTAHAETVLRASPRGRPKLKNPKRLITFRLDGDLIDELRGTGPGWQSRVKAILRKAVVG